MTDAAAPAGELEADQFLVLNVICLKKMATSGGIADACESSVEEVEAILDTLVVRGLVGEAGGQYLPTNDAVPAAEAWADRAYDDLRRDEDVDKYHGRFEKVNASFLQAMTDWQQVPIGDKRIANDHGDAAYDAKVISTITGLVQRQMRILDVLAEHVPRLTTYKGRFVAAIERVAEGQTEYVASPTVDSVHNVWFEFHEDLLRILGKEREE